ncbi:hypothetical protein KL86PLE_60526 [uncultured Pleomorphomonas sp.]|uniref:Uncharacterized protein n=1 Tax=uncultured Pleomorphomonas sp. TaxID=442121 RepID=A0A212LKX9_9HYPH|nr:hypothetical protein [uncultured Pleomorphomonas sp.]SCM78203.1 hypothetical protein KL86PLE_60526 [uncultured Pleomorphomonas sp.]
MRQNAFQIDHTGKRHFLNRKSSFWPYRDASLVNGQVKEEFFACAFS